MVVIIQYGISLYWHSILAVGFSKPDRSGKFRAVVQWRLGAGITHLGRLAQNTQGKKSEHWPEPRSELWSCLVSTQRHGDSCGDCDAGCIFTLTLMQLFQIYITLHLELHFIFQRITVIKWWILSAKLYSIEVIYLKKYLYEWCEPHLEVTVQIKVTQWGYWLLSFMWWSAFIPPWPKSR